MSSNPLFGIGPYGSIQELINDRLEATPGTEQFDDAHRQTLEPGDAMSTKNSLGRAEHLKSGLVRQHLYEVEIAKWTGKTLIAVNCEIASLPAASLSTNPLRIYGPISEMPYERLYTGDLSLTFRLDKEFLLRKEFIKWQEEIYKSETGDFGYYDNYITTLKIAQLDGEGEELYKIELEDVYPKTVGPIELGYAQNDTYSKQTVDFAYRKWKEIE
tara:strand:- start:4703 stop:5347 length:645 start_codon:yes stop_codon:yes gene_type:complete